MKQPSGSRRSVGLDPNEQPISIHTTGSRSASLGDLMQIRSSAGIRTPLQFADEDKSTGAQVEVRGTCPLPQPTAAIVGRHQDITAVRQLVHEHGLTTITGPGGSGKTRLAVEVAMQLRTAFADGVCFASLTEVSAAPALMSTVAIALGLYTSDQMGTAAMVDHLRSKAMLILLDNCEQVAHECGRLVAEIISSCPGVRILGTSRRSLKVSGEQLWPIAGLAFPQWAAPLTPAEALSYAGMQLLVDRARSYDPAFGLTPLNLKPMIECCELVDGLPLGLQLLAPRLRSFSPAQLAALLRTQAVAIGSTLTPTAEHHITLQAAIDWSFQLLDERERQVWLSLSVFVDGFDYSAVRAMCSFIAEPNDLANVMDIMVDCSLIQYESHGERYRILEPLRQFAHAKIAQSGSLAPLENARRDWCISALRAGMTSSVNYHSVAAREYQNICASLASSIEAGDRAEGVNLCLLMNPFWYRKRRLEDGLRWFDAVLIMEGNVPVSLHADALQSAAWLNYTANKLSRAEHLLVEALNLLNTDDDLEVRAHALIKLGVLYGAQGQYQKAIETLREARTIGSQLAEARTIGVANVNIAIFSTALGDSVTARSNLEEAAIVDSYVEPLNLIAWGDVFRIEGDWSTARAHYNQAVAQARQTGYDDALTMGLERLAQIDQSEGDLASARDSLVECMRILEGMSNNFRLTMILRGLGGVEWQEGNIPSALSWFSKAHSLLAEIMNIPCSLGELLSLKVIEGASAYRSAVGSALDRICLQYVDRYRELGNFLGIMGDVALLQGHFRTASMYYERAIVVFRPHYGESRLLSLMHRTVERLGRMSINGRGSAMLMRVVYRCYENGLSPLPAEQLMRQMVKLFPALRPLSFVLRMIDKHSD